MIFTHKENVKNMATPSATAGSPNEDSELKETGPSRVQNQRYYFSTQDLLIIAVLGVMGGFISQFVPFDLLVKTWYPLMGGTQLVSGHHILWFVIAYGLTRKRLSILATAAIKSIVMVLLGTDLGLMEFVVSVLIEGLPLLFGFWFLEKCREKNTFLGYGLAAGIGNLVQVPFFWIYTGKIWILDPSLFILAIIFGFVSGVFFAGVLGKVIVDRLHKAGVV